MIAVTLVAVAFAKKPSAEHLFNMGKSDKCKALLGAKVPLGVDPLTDGCGTPNVKCPLDWPLHVCIADAGKPATDASAACKQRELRLLLVPSVCSNTRLHEGRTGLKCQVCANWLRQGRSNVRRVRRSCKTRNSRLPRPVAADQVHCGL